MYVCVTDDSRRRRGSLTSAAGDYNSDNDLEEALMSGAHYGRSTRRTRGRLERSHSVCDTTSHDDEDTGSSKTEGIPGPGEDGGRPREERVRRATSARRLRLTASFDDGCSERERVSARIGSTTPDRPITSSGRTSSTCSINTDVTLQLDARSGRNHTQKPRLRSASLARLGGYRSASNSTSSLCDQPRSNTPKTGPRGQKMRGINANRLTSKHAAECYCLTSGNNSKKIPSVTRQEDTANSKRPSPRASLVVRRASLDMKSCDGDKMTTGRQPNAARSGHRDQMSSKASIYQSGTMSANSSPLPTRSDRLQSCGSHTARYQWPSSFYFIAYFTPESKPVQIT